MDHRTEWEARGNFFNSSISFPPALQTLRHDKEQEQEQHEAKKTKTF